MQKLSYKVEPVLNPVDVACAEGSYVADMADNQEEIRTHGNSRHSFSNSYNYY